MRHRVVEVEWIDSCSFSGWKPIDYYRTMTDAEEKAVCRSVGYLLRSDKDGVALIQNFDRVNDNVSDAIFIPRSVVISERVLRKGETVL